ncbi:malonyl-ACP O-methyltransferase BioC [Immundisolibacter sp.]|uniref:malonyl-ACP O-methyltransferase BioC n=1 Tax=Immundisolibacter sp. TaxID=1934948 RepID=UPI003562C9CF
MNNDTAAQFRLDKRLVRGAFNRAAPHYEAVAVLQRTVEAHCLERLDLITVAPGVIVDLGCGPGAAGRSLLARYKRAQVLALDLAPAMLQLARRRRRWFSAQRFVCADAEALPLAADGVDLVFSSLALPWCNDLGQALAEAWRVLRPGGLLMFSSLGPDTLKELRHAWGQVDGRTHVNAFIDMHDVGDALVRSGFESPVLDVEHFRLTYSDIATLATDLRRSGSRNATAGRPARPIGKSAWAALAAAYEAFRVDGFLPASYEVVYAHAWKPLQVRRRAAEGEQTLTFHPVRRGLT